VRGSGDVVIPGDCYLGVAGLAAAGAETERRAAYPGQEHLPPGLLRHETRYQTGYLRTCLV